jgi:hypothetical protein
MIRLTDRDWAMAEHYCACGSFQATARAFGTHRMTVQRRVERIAPQLASGSWTCGLGGEKVWRAAMEYQAGRSARAGTRTAIAG